MTIVRRVLILIVLVLLVADAGALAYLKLNSGDPPSPEKSKVVFWIDDAAQAEQAAEILKGMDYEPILKAAKREDYVQANYRLVHSAERKELLVPIANVLKKSGHKNLSFSEDGTELYYGGTYAKKAEAQRLAKSLEAKEYVIFDVKPGRKKTMVDSNRVILLEVPDNYIPVVTAALTDPGEITIQDQTETSLESEVEEEELEEEAEEE